MDGASASGTATSSRRSPSSTATSRSASRARRSSSERGTGRCHDPRPIDTRSGSSADARRSHNRASSAATTSRASTTLRCSLRCCSSWAACTARSCSTKRPVCSQRARTARLRRRRAATAPTAQVATVAAAPTAANSANNACPSTAASRPAPPAATPAPTSPTSGGPRCSTSGSGTSRSGDLTDVETVGPRRTIRRHGSRPAATTLPPIRRPVTPAAPAARSRAQRTSIRLAPISIVWPGTTRCAGSHGRPSIRTGTRPVSWMNTIEPASSTSRNPWCSSTPASSRRMSADIARPTVCRPEGRGCHEVHDGPATTASSTTASSTAASSTAAAAPGARGGLVLVPIVAPVGSGFDSRGRHGRDRRADAKGAVAEPTRALLDGPVDAQRARGRAECNGQIGDRVGRAARTEARSVTVDGHLTRGDRFGGRGCGRAHAPKWAPRFVPGKHRWERFGNGR